LALPLHHSRHDPIFGQGRGYALVLTLARKKLGYGSGCRKKGEANGFSPVSFQLAQASIILFEHATWRAYVLVTLPFEDIQNE
jgi:hypothetical protein